MSDAVTKFPPQTYSSSFYLNSIDGGKKAVAVDVEKEVEQPPILDCFISTMKLFVVLPLLLLVEVKGEFRKCVLDREPKYRDFGSILEYQANKFCFDPDYDEYKGNYIRFSFRSINKLPRNVFISYCSDLIIKIDLSNKNISFIEDEAFNGLFCLHYLVLQNNIITKLTKDVFKNLGILRTLDLKNNNLETLCDLTFSYLKELEVLDLSNNNIRIISAMAFNQLSMLRLLDLSENNLQFFDFHNVADMDNLEMLNLARNTLHHVEFAKVEHLQVLNLSLNNLELLDASNLNHTLVSLTNMDLNQNKFHCNYLSQMLLQISTAINVNGMHHSIISDNNVNGITCVEENSENSTLQLETAKENLKINVSEISAEHEKIQRDSKNTKVLLNNLQMFVCVVVILMVTFYGFGVLVKIGAVQNLWNSCRLSSRFRNVKTSNNEYISLIRTKYETIG